MATVQEKYSQLLTALARKNAAGSLAWILDEWDDPYVEVGQRKIFLETISDEGELNVVVRIVDKDGVLIDRFTARDFRGMVSPLGSVSYADLMLNLRNSALRQASGADKALDALIAELDDGE